MQTEWLNHPKVLQATQENIEYAIDIVSNGGVAILPADTVYGFFTVATKQESVDRIYNIKRRERRKPFVIYTNQDKVGDVVDLNDVAKQLIDQVWPKALSLILPKRKIIADWFTNHQPTLAVMTAQNRVVSQLIAGVKEPVLGTTCNISGEPELKKAEQVFQFIDQVDVLIADDSIPIYNKPSTMIDCTVTPPKIARLSSLSLEELRTVIPELEVDLERRLS